MSLIKSQSTIRRPSMTPKRSRKDSTIIGASSQSDLSSHRNASRKFAPLQLSTASSPMPCMPMYVSPKPWTKSSPSHYWNLNRRSTDAVDISSSSSPLVKQQNHDGGVDRLFVKSVETFNDDDVLTQSSSNGRGAEAVSANINNGYSIVLNEQNFATMPSSLSHSKSPTIDTCQKRQAPKFHSFLQPTTTTTTTNEFYETFVSPTESSSSSTSPPWVNVKTGYVSQRVLEKSPNSFPPPQSNLLSSSSSIVSANRFLPTENERVSSIKRVTNLAKQFENGDVDQIGPLKLYHTQAYKRELEKISSRNSGSVLQKAQNFETPSSKLGAPRLSLNDYSSLSSVYTSSTSSVGGGDTQRRYSDCNRMQSSIIGDSSIAFSYENLFKRKSTPTTSSSIITPYFNSTVQSTPDVSLRDQNSLNSSVKHKRRFGGLPSRHESFLQAVSPSSPAIAYSWSKLQ